MQLRAVVCLSIFALVQASVLSWNREQAAVTSLQSGRQAHYSQSTVRANAKLRTSRDGDRTLVIYAWFEMEHEIPNLMYFLKNAVAKEESSSFDFLFIDTTPGGSKYLPQESSNVRVMTRSNEGFDTRSWAVGLSMVNKADYANFVLTNGCVRGPFLGRFPSSPNFVSPFAQLLHGNVHLAGTTVNCLCQGPGCNINQLHLQSMFLVTDRVGIDVVNSTLQSGTFRTKDDSIYHGEVAMSQNMLKAGYGIAALQQFWKGNDFLNSAVTLQKCLEYAANAPRGSDPYAPDGGNYVIKNGHSAMHGDPDPEELVMFKTNRNIANARLRLLSGHDADIPPIPSQLLLKAKLQPQILQGKDMTAAVLAAWEEWQKEQQRAQQKRKPSERQQQVLKLQPEQLQKLEQEAGEEANTEGALARNEAVDVPPRPPLSQDVILRALKFAKMQV